MKTQVLYLITICITALQSCVMTNIVDETDQTVKSQPTAQYGRMVVKIQNNANNTCLQIDSIEICNIALEETSTLQKYRGDITVLLSGIQNQTGDSLTEGFSLLEGAEISSNEIKLPQQKFSPWSPNTLPSRSNKQYIKIHGKLYTYTSGNNTILLTGGPLYTPLHGEITENETLSATVTLQSNCPLYTEYNGTMVKVLQEISFNPSVNDWEEEVL